MHTTYLLFLMYINLDVLTSCKCLQENLAGYSEAKTIIY
jgi:hypothetical protein